MKILFIASTFGHLKNFHIPYIKELMLLGHEVHIGGKGNYFDVTQMSDYIEQQVMGSLPLPKYKIFGVPFVKNTLSKENFKAIKELTRVIQEEKYDKIILHTTLASYVTRRALVRSGLLKYGKMLNKYEWKEGRGNEDIKPQVINIVHGYLFDEKTPTWKRWALLLAEKVNTKVTNVVVTMNEEDLQIAKTKHLYKDKLYKIPGMGIDLQRFSPISKADEKVRAEAREKLWLKDEDFVMVYAAEFSKRKNQRMLIKAMESLPSSVKLILAGEGELLGQCKQMVNLQRFLGDTKKKRISVLDDKTYRFKGNRILLPGHVVRIEDYYKIADLCISSSRSEGLPFNIMEAMAAGLPIVASRVKGHTDLIQPGINGYLYESDNVEEFCVLVKKLMADVELRKQMGENNRVEAERYSIERVKPEVMEIYLK